MQLSDSGGSLFDTRLRDQPCEREAVRPPQSPRSLRAAAEVSCKHSTAPRSVDLHAPRADVTRSSRWVRA